MSISFVAAIIVGMYYQVIWSNTKLFLGTVMARIKLICLRVILYMLMEVESSSFVGDRLPPQPNICMGEGYRCCFLFRNVRRTCPSCKAAVSAGERGSNSSSSKQMIGGMQNSSEQGSIKAEWECLTCTLLNPVQVTMCECCGSFKTKEFQAGDRVEAAYDGGLNYFSGQVIRVTDVGLYDIKYDDGDFEQNVHPQFIRALQQPAEELGAELLEAAEWGYTETVELLVDRGADVNLQDSMGRTALFYAADRENTETVGLLVERGADVNHQDSKGRTALMLAAIKGDKGTVELLVDRGADVNHQDSDGATALMAAADGGHTETVGLLLNRGADVNLKAIGGLTALQAANQRRNREVAQMLKREERKKIAQQEEKSSFPFYVMPRKKFLELTVIVTHEQALEESLLVILVKRDGKLYIDGTNTEVDRTQIVFFSQRWFSKDHPDNKNNLKLNGSQACLDNIELSDVYYVWFDLFCVPQAKDKKEEQLQAVMSLPYYVRNCYHFVTLLAKTDDYDDVKVMDEMKQFDKGSLETYDSRGWCRVEKLAASSPPIIVNDGNIKRLPAAKMWQYHINSETLDEWSFAFANANTVDPLKGSFSAKDVEAEKRKVAPMVLQLCAYIENFSGVNQIRKHGANIQMLAETYAGLDEGFDVNKFKKLAEEKRNSMGKQN